MNYDEGEVARYPTDSFEGDLVLPCFLDNELMLMSEEGVVPIEPSALETPILCNESEQQMFQSVATAPEPSSILIPDLALPEIQLQPTCLPAVTTRMPAPLQTRPQAIPQTRIISKPVILSPQPNSPVACYPPAIAFPFVPFWTGCPLPFDPRTYPQPVVPQMHQSEVLNGGTTKEEKISKYRLKRCKRNFNRPVDPQRSSIAEKRPRDEKGKFTEPQPSPSLGKRVERSLRAQVEELKERLALSETESRALREKLSYMEQELRLLKLTAHTTNSNTIVIEDDQRPTDKPKMSTSPPTAYGFNSTNTLLQDSFSEKIDFSKIELRKTDSPHLEAERRKTDLPLPFPSLSLATDLIVL